MTAIKPSHRTATGTPAYDALDETLAYAALMADARACVLDIAPQRGAPEGLVLGWGMTYPDARRFCSWLCSTLDHRDAGDGEPLDVPPERWPASASRPGGAYDGVAIALHLADQTGSLGWIALLGGQAMLQQPSLAIQRIYAAFVGQLTLSVRQALDMRTLSEQRDQLASIFRSSGDGILTVDAMLRVTGCNPALEALTGWHADAMLGKFYYDVLRLEDQHHEPLGLTRCPLVEAFAISAPVMREIVIHARDGQPIDVAVTASPVLSPEGLPVSGVLNVRDVSRSRENETLSSTIVSVVSHELQTPISIIKGYASTLSRPDAIWTGDALRQRLHAIEEESDRLSHMVANLLYASRIQAGGLAMQPAPLEIGDVLAAGVRRFTARGIQHPLRLRLPEHLPAVIGDRERIEEVVANLLDNAMKYSPLGTAIVVEARCTGDEVIVAVNDGGAGIPLREQDRVFDRFQRVEGDLTRKTAGAGLGLYICQAI
ncbi:MAG TPA: ATP-binding protein, partial [Ktedonobacterales bacterium]|nr:ATP-binding protein [Ktedonobacterales bacterium]